MQIGGAADGKVFDRQRKRLLEYLSEHTDEQMSARQIADALATDEISVSAVYRNLSALEEEGLLKRSVGKERGKSFSNTSPRRNAKTVCTCPAASAERAYT